jgi:hypothetical protein
MAFDLVWAAGWALGALPAYRPAVHAVVLLGAAGVAAALVLVGVVLNAVTAGFRELAALGRRPR